MILVTGATGELGSATIDFLLKKVPNDQVIGFAKDSEKADALEKKGITVKRGIILIILPCYPHLEELKKF